MMLSLGVNDDLKNLHYNVTFQFDFDDKIKIFKQLRLFSLNAQKFAGSYTHAQIS